MAPNIPQEDEMFDKMIESNSAAADFRPRRNYFMVSTVVVGALFLAAVVISIYAGDIGLGNTDFELSELLAPIQATDPETEPPPSSRARNEAVSNELPSRVVNMVRVDETQLVPSTTSVVPNQFRARPIGDFELRPDGDRDPSGNPGLARGSNTPGTGLGLSKSSESKVTDDKPTPEPPPVVRTQPNRTKYIGVINGIATYLPKPPYPPTAITMNIQGKVDVQVTIDETGKVISAKAASGHPFLRQAAEKAAWSARFSPTYLSKIPVKVTGVIIYNFTR